MTTEQWETPEWDRLVADRLGRGPAEFEGFESWDDSEEAKEAYARGVAEAEATKDAFWGRVAPGERTSPEPPDKAPAKKARAEKAPAEKAPAEKATAEKATAEKAPAEKAPAGRARQGSTRAS